MKHKLSAPTLFWTLLTGLLLLGLMACSPATETQPAPTAVVAERETPTEEAAPAPDTPAPVEETETAESASPVSPLLDEPVSRPPADQPHEPPPVWHSNVDGKWLPTTIRAATDLVNWAEGDAERILAQIETWGEIGADLLAEGRDGAFVLPNAWVETADFNQDGQSELLLAFPKRQELCVGDDCRIVLCTFIYCPAYILFFTQTNDIFVPVQLLRDSDQTDRQDWFDVPTLFHMGDVTGDGRIEVLIQQDRCGAHTCFSNLLIGGWDGNVWQSYGSLKQSYTEISLVLDSESEIVGRMEIQFQGGIIGSAGAGLQRQRTEIYRFDEANGRYQLTERIPDPDDHPYYLVLDAHSALNQHDPDRAYDLATNALAHIAAFRNDARDFMFLDDWSVPRIAGLAHLQRLMVAALDDDMPAMLIERDTIIPYDVPVYAQAAQTFIDIYEETADPAAACAEMDAVLQAQPDQSALFDWFGYSTEMLASYCPLA
jgi:hypothetical protein